MSFLRCDLPYPSPEFTQERWPWIGGDLQTLRNNFVHDAPQLPQGEDQHIPLNDGDRLLVCHHKTTQPRKGAVILIHGLAGDYDSSYIRHLARGALQVGYDVFRVNLRGAGKGRALATSSYHAGRALDLQKVAIHVKERYLDKPVYLCAFSLGGTMAVNLAARYKIDHLLAGIVCFCAPLDMLACSYEFHKPRNWLYVRHFTKALIAQASAGPVPNVESGAPIDMRQVKASRTVRDFDHHFTCKVAGFESADTYYKGTTPLAELTHITVPTLLVHSDNDPWIPVVAYEKINHHDNLFCVITRGGGHMGFHITGNNKGCWQTQTTLAFISWLSSR